MGKYDALLQKKQEAIKANLRTKEIGMDVNNSATCAKDVFNALLSAGVIKINTPEDALREITDIFDYFQGLKQEEKKEMTAEQALEETKRVFPGAEPTPGSAPGADNFAPMTTPQRGKLFALFKQQGYAEEKKRAAFAEMALGLPKVESLEKMNDGRGPSKSQASKMIEELLHD